MLYVLLIKERTEEMRRVTDNKFFKFDEEDRIISFDYRKYLKETPLGKLKPYGKKYKIKNYTTMSRWQLYCKIMELPREDIVSIVCELIAKDKVYSIYEEDLKFISRHELDRYNTYKDPKNVVNLNRLFIIDYNNLETLPDDNTDDSTEEIYMLL